MSSNLIQHAFIAGEISPQLIHRSDLEKYDLGVALARNFFVDYRGGLSTRPGTQFLDYIQHQDRVSKFLPFEFGTNVADTYIVLFGHQYIRFIQDEGYVLETAQDVVSITLDNPLALEVTTHGFSAGDWIKPVGIGGTTELNNNTYEVGTVVDSNNFTLLDVHGDLLDGTGFTAFTSGGTVARIYTVVSPYAVADLENLRFHQIFDTLRLTHKDYKTRNLVRVTASSWTLTEETIGNTATRPSGLAISFNGGTGTSSGVAFTVTAISKSTGIESQPADIKIKTNIGDHTQSAGSLHFSWDPLPDTAYYKIYRSIVTRVGVEISLGHELGFIGRAFGTEFTDNNIIPDFTAQPPLFLNPFADGAIDQIDVDAVGTGYAKSDAISITDPTGSGFIGFPVVTDGGDLTTIIILNGGFGYTSPTVVITTSGGADAEFTVTVGPTSGNNPALGARFQQRQIYAATENESLTIFGSRPGQLANFDVSQIITEGDSYTLQLDSAEATPIRHIVDTRGGMLTMTQKGVWQLRGGGLDVTVAVTPINALADKQNYSGVGVVEPLPINNDILYIEGKGTTVRLLSYSSAAKLYSGLDMSILANHLFKTDNQIIRWSFESDPSKLVYAVREDGRLLTFTVVKEQEIFAWTQHQTKGQYKDVITIQEGVEDATYYAVRRYINGKWVKLIEKQARREITEVENAWCVDTGLALPQTTPDAILLPGAATGSGVTFTTDTGVFVSGDVGKIIRAGGGKGTVATYVSATEITVDLARDIIDVIPEDDNDTPLEVASGDWTLDAKVTVISGLGHLEGETVTGLMDGNVITPQAVVNGAITLETGATKVTIGIGFVCLIQTLPPTTTNAVIESRRKRHVGTGIRVANTRGLKHGATLDRMYEMKDRTTELYGEAIPLLDKLEYIVIEDDFDENGQTYYQQTYPLPATILGHVSDMEIGDDSD